MRSFRSASSGYSSPFLVILKSADASLMDPSKLKLSTKWPRPNYYATEIKEAQRDDGELWAIVQNVEDGKHTLSSSVMMNGAVWFREIAIKLGETRLNSVQAFHPQTDGHQRGPCTDLEDMLRFTDMSLSVNRIHMDQQKRAMRNKVIVFCEDLWKHHPGLRLPGRPKSLC
ncbi:hypothetical protein Tco_0039535 [Tanacetum coccineum]|uniref:Uncharacterized protein n=1 Tax=Tanacetum coccineum TaxID=301880 RepID=A0ABQ5GYM3_9ASTR